MVQYDVIIVLGHPATKDGKPGVIMATRVEKAIELFNQQLANKIIVSGNSVYNQFNEAAVMAELAILLGIPPKAIIQETAARNSYENAKFTVDILKSNNWTKAIVVTSLYHRKRARYIFSHYDIEYKIVVANYPKRFSTVNKLIYNLWETWLFTKLYLFGDRRLPLTIPKR